MNPKNDSALETSLGAPESGWLKNLTADERREFGDIFLAAVETVQKTRSASTSRIQRRLRIGYNRAWRILQAMERLGLVGPENGCNPRDVLIPAESPKSETRWNSGVASPDILWASDAPEARSLGPWTAQQVSQPGDPCMKGCGYFKGECPECLVAATQHAMANPATPSPGTLPNDPVSIETNVAQSKVSDAS